MNGIYHQHKFEHCNHLLPLLDHSESSESGTAVDRESTPEALQFSLAGVMILSYHHGHTENVRSSSDIRSNRNVFSSKG